MSRSGLAAGLSLALCVICCNDFFSAYFAFYGAINPKHLINLGVGVFANSGQPYNILTGDDNYGTNLFNARPDGQLGDWAGLRRF